MPVFRGSELPAGFDLVQDAVGQRQISFLRLNRDADFDLGIHASQRLCRGYGSGPATS